MDARDKVRAWMEGDFLPVGNPEVEYRVASALEYIAYHAGKIDQTLRDLNATLKEISMKSKA